MNQRQEEILEAKKAIFKAIQLIRSATHGRVSNEHHVTDLLHITITELEQTYKNL